MATPQFATAIVLIACDVAAHVADAAGRRMGQDESVARLRQRATAVRTLITDFDISTGEPRGLEDSSI